MPARRSFYKVETTFGDSVQGKTYHLARQELYAGKEYDAEFKLIHRFLQSEGMKSVEDTKRKPDFQISYVTDRKDPPTGIAVGVILPYTHIVKLTAKERGKVDWQVKVTGESEEKQRRYSLHRLLGAARHFFGKSTAVEQRIQLPDDDPEMIELQGSGPLPPPPVKPGAGHTDQE